MRKESQIELYIISAALILALVIIGIFLALNRGQKPRYTFTQPAVTGAAKPKPVVSKTTNAPVSNEQKTITHQGLAKIMDPTPVKALIIGDSIAESQGASDKNSTGWYTLVANDLHSKYPGTLQWQLKTSTSGIINDALKITPEISSDTDLIVVCLGRSDSGRLKLSAFKQRYEQLLGDLKAKCPQADIFLLTEPPVKNIWENNRYFPFCETIIGLAQKYQLHVIDEWTAFINDPTPLSALLADNVNPNDKGYRIFADAVLKGFNEYLLPAN